MNTLMNAAAPAGVLLNRAGTTVLFALEPCGLGTSEVESLSSYVRRLAAEHVVRPALLLSEYVVVPTYGAVKSKQGFEPSKVTQSIDGARAATTLLIKTLAQLNGRVDLERLALAGRLDAIDTHDAFRQRRAWCPLCLREDPDPFDRLLWSISRVTTCPRHAVVLVEECPGCARGHRPWQARRKSLGASATLSLVRLCPLCGADLALAEPEPRRDHAPSIFLSSLIGYLETGGRVRQDAVRYGIAAAVERLGGLQAATTLVERSKNGIAGPRRGASRANLATVVALATAVGEDFATFVTHEPCTLRVAHGGHRPAAKSVALLEEALRQSLAGPDENLPSILQLTAELSTTPELLRRRLPDLGRELTRRRARARARQRDALQADHARQVRDAVRELHAKTGQLPGRRAVECALPKVGMLRSPALRRAFKDAVAELTELPR